MFNIVYTVGLLALTGLQPTAQPDSTNWSASPMASSSNWDGEVKTVKWSDIEAILNSSSNDIYVFNFWATYCKPCVNELPHFDKLHNQYQYQNVKVILVSMDFIKDFETKVPNFLQQLRIQSPVWLFNETNTDALLNNLDASWSGALPATLFIHPARKQKKFINKELSYQELQMEFSQFQKSVIGY